MPIRKLNDVQVVNGRVVALQRELPTFPRGGGTFLAVPKGSVPATKADLKKAFEVQRALRSEFLRGLELLGIRLAQFVDARPWLRS